MSKDHCRYDHDAVTKVWEALGSPAYDGRHVSEHVAEVVAHVAAMQAELGAAKRWQLDVEEREAAVCPEDVGFDEYIRSLHGRVDQLRERVVGAPIKHMSIGRRAIVNRTGAEVRDEIIQIVNQLFPTTTEGRK